MPVYIFLHSATIEFSPYISNQYQSLSALLFNRVTKPLIYFHLHTTIWSYIQHLQLSHLKFQSSTDIDILLDADNFAQLGKLCGSQTHSGYILKGKTASKAKTKKSLITYFLDSQMINSRNLK